MIDIVIFPTCGRQLTLLLQVFDHATFDGSTSFNDIYLLPNYAGQKYH